MSAETREWLNTNVLVGCVAKRGKAWHYSGADQGDESNHYDAGIPVADVNRRLFHWTAESAPVVNGRTFDVADGYQLIYRSDTGAPFGVFSAGYKIHQYPEWLIDNVATVLDASAGELVIASAGLLMGGAVGWVQIERPDNVLIGGDTLRPFIVATTSHNGKFATSYKHGTTRVVCDNTLSMFHNGARGFSIKHTSNSVGRLAEARAMLDVTFQAQSAELAEFDQLMNTAVTDAQFRSIVASLEPIPDAEGRARTMAEGKVAKLDTLWQSDPRVAPFRGTAWGAVQAFNTYDHHYASVRGMVRPERNRLSFLQGKTDAGDSRVLTAVRELIGAGA